MLIYKENDKLITTSLGNPYSNSDLMPIRFNAIQFEGKDNRFYKVLSVEPVLRSIKYSSREKMNEEAIKRFTQMSGEHHHCEYYDEEKNIGYKVYPYMKKNPTVYTYSKLLPAITEFFKCWRNSFEQEKNSKILNPYDLSHLFESMKNFNDLSLLFAKESAEELKKALYQNFPEFAIFCYEIYPHLDIQSSKSYDIAKLVQARSLVYELGLDTTEIDHLLESQEIANNNAQILKLIKQI